MKDFVKFIREQGVAISAVVYFVVKGLKLDKKKAKP